MKDRPILMNAPMVSATLEGRKRQTRRVCKPAEAAALTRVIPASKSDDEGQRPPYITPGWFGDEDGYVLFFSPYGVPGDRLWVREAFCDATKAMAGRVLYRATGDIACGWKPSIHMPRWASRILLEITNIRIERLQDISEADALAEGVFKKTGTTPIGDTVETVTGGELIYAVPTQARFEFSRLWESINGPGSWDVNPWVWVVEFKVIQPSGVMG